MFEQDYKEDNKGSSWSPWNPSTQKCIESIWQYLSQWSLLQMQEKDESLVDVMKTVLNQAIILLQGPKIMEDFDSKMKAIQYKICNIRNKLNMRN